MSAKFNSSYIISLPGWFCFFKVIELSLLRSKNPRMAKPLLDPQTTGYLHRYSWFSCVDQGFYPQVSAKEYKA